VFPPTRWGLVADAGDSHAEARTEILNTLILQYWKPCYYYLLRAGHTHDDACDLVQGFFAKALEKNLFQGANPTRGRFRTLLLTALNNYRKNVHRDRLAAIRCPAAGLVSLDELTEGDNFHFEPHDEETPETLFNRAWAATVVQHVLKAFERYCQDTGKPEHYTIFRERMVRPTLEGSTPPPLRDLAESLGLSEKQAANCLITGRRIFQKLLLGEIRQYLPSDQESIEEIQELMGLLYRA